LIILIYLDSAAVQMFFPNKNDFFISERELATFTFRQVLDSRGLNIVSFEKGFMEIEISIDLPMIDFLQKLFNSFFSSSMLIFDETPYSLSFIFLSIFSLLLLEEIVVFG
jgi:hypothetical protein